MSITASFLPLLPNQPGEVEVQAAGVPVAVVVHHDVDLQPARGRCEAHSDVSAGTCESKRAPATMRNVREGVAQLVEQRPFKPWVLGSSPSTLSRSALATDAQPMPAHGVTAIPTEVCSFADSSAVVPDMQRLPGFGTSNRVDAEMADGSSMRTPRRFRSLVKAP